MIDEADRVQPSCLSVALSFRKAMELAATAILTNQVKSSVKFHDALSNTVAIVAKLWPKKPIPSVTLDQPSVKKREMAQIPRWLQPVYCY